MSFRWTKQDRGFFAWRGQAIIGFVTEMGVTRNDGATHAWQLTTVKGTTWLKTRGHVRSMAQAKRSLRRAWRTWLEVHGLQEVAPAAGVEPACSSFGDRAAPSARR